MTKWADLRFDEVLRDCVYGEGLYHDELGGLQICVGLNRAVFRNGLHLAVGGRMGSDGLRNTLAKP